MANGRTRRQLPKHFITAKAHHWPRVQRSSQLLMVAWILLPLGLYLVANDLPETSIRRAQLMASYTPTFFGAILLLFGAWGVGTAVLAMRRKGVDAIDAKIRASGLILRGGRKVAWGDIGSVTAISFQNDAKVQLLWDRAELHRRLEVQLKQPETGTLRIDLVRYPAVDYLGLYESLLDEFERQRIPVKHRKKWMQA
ncbi:hypothetical protein [Glutamicibacter nicotianae]|uniref:hypothetical protein n=1 Tax=Glutamicibacter nicotianae TaxID=37929 RepID=UPI0019579CB7|nr:hypothetical protein [Glutamicibacter nicotianae]MBM7769635.1 hypothetical protein [Glutamicibacter nicotianae]